jgi:hypothetical protein
MGQQQLLLIVLGVILVGVAVVLGIQYFGVGAEEGAKDELTAHCITIGANAQQWFKKPTSMGGGGNSFVGFGAHFTNNLVSLQTSTNGTYETDAGAAALVTITGRPITTLGYDWIVTTRVTPDSINTVISGVTP